MQTLRDRLSRLSYEKAASLLGTNGKKLLKLGVKSQIDLDSDIEITKNVFRIKVKMQKTESPLALALQESFKSISKATPDGKMRMEFTFDSQDAINSQGSTIAMLLEASGKKMN